MRPSTSCRKCVKTASSVSDDMLFTAGPFRKKQIPYETKYLDVEKKVQGRSVFRSKMISTLDVFYLDHRNKMKNCTEKKVSKWSQNNGGFATRQGLHIKRCIDLQKCFAVRQGACKCVLREA